MISIHCLAVCNQIKEHSRNLCFHQLPRRHENIAISASAAVAANDFTTLFWLFFNIKPLTRFKTVYSFSCVFLSSLLCLQRMCEFSPNAEILQYLYSILSFQFSLFPTLKAVFAKKLGELFNVFIQKQTLDSFHIWVLGMTLVDLQFKWFTFLH